MCNERSGRSASFDDVWIAHRDAVERQCRALLGQRPDVEDAVSLTAMKALQSYRPIADGGHALAWLLTIARNVCVDFQRSMSRRRRHEVSLDDDPYDAGMAVASIDCEPERVLLRREEDARVRAALEALPQRLRAVAELHLLREIGYGDIARELGMSPANVRKQMQHVRAHLRGETRERRPAKRAAPRADASRTLIALPPREIHGEERDAFLVLSTARPRTPLAGAAALESYIARHPSGWRRRLRLARILAAGGALEEAVPQYRAAIRKQPYPLPPWLELADVLRLLGREDEAVAAYAYGAREVGREPDRLLLHGLLASARNDERAALELLAAGTESTHLTVYGARLLASSRFAEAAAVLRRALALPSPEPLAAPLAADALFALGGAGEARALLREAHARDAENAAVLARLIACSGAEEGERLLRALRRAAPQHGATTIAAAALLAARGRRAAAEATLAEYCEAHPRHAEARRALDRLRAGASIFTFPPH